VPAAGWVQRRLSPPRPKRPTFFPIGKCLDRKATDDMWEAATANVVDARTINARPKGVPWHAAALTGDLLRLAQHPELLGEADDLERCIAVMVVNSLSWLAP
jgi:hypothetical protein